MVSTRGPRNKFSEGERVLCYEPDPTKAKVLYDSKVVEVREAKDRRGRRSIEYIIHFQGWNSSWDRCVSEDFVLKDTEENRQLQRELAERSQLQLGAYLYRRDRKKNQNSTSGGPSKRTRSSGFEDDESSSSTQPDDGEVDTDSSSGSYGIPPSLLAHLPLSQTLQDRLNFDNHLVVSRGRIVWLPSRPSVADVLQVWAQQAARQLILPPIKRTRQATPSLIHADPMLLAQKINMLREVADGLRIYFDIILSGHLLYRQEVQQYHDIVRTIKGSESESDLDDYDMSQDEDDLDESGEERNDDYKREEKFFANHNEDHKNDIENNIHENEEPPPPPLPENENTRRLRSSTLSQQNANSTPPHKESTPPLSPPPLNCNSSPRSLSVSSPLAAASTSSHEEAGYSRRTTRRTTGGTESAKINLLLERIDKWELIPREDTAHLPCRIYGPIHLLRMFVKLPEFLSVVPMPDTKLKLLLKHIEMVVQFLEDHEEWFGENYYSSENPASSA